MSDNLLVDRVHPPATRVHRADVLSLLSEKLFQRTVGLAHADRIDLLYRRLQRIDQWDTFTDEPKDEDWRYHALMEQVAVVDPALWLACVVHFGVSQGILKRFPELPDVRTLVRRLKSRGEIAVLLVTELGHAGSATSSRTVARFDAASRQFRLSTPDAGATKLMANAAAPGIAKIAVVAAELVDSHDQRCGRFYFVVPLRNTRALRPGVTIAAADEGSTASLDVGLISFDDVRVPYGRWLRGGASLDASGALTDASPEERARRYFAGTHSMWFEASRALAAIARAASATAIRFTTVREVSDPAGLFKNAIDIRPVQESVLGALVSALALTFLVNNGDHDDTSALSNNVGLRKVIACDIAENVVRRSRERCGALGLLSANRFSEYEAFVQRARYTGGDNQIISLEIARSVLAARRADAPTRDDGPAGRAGGDPSDLSYWLALARRREQSLMDAVETVADSAEPLVTKDFHASNDSLSLAVAAVAALGERLLLEAFERELARFPESGETGRLLRSCALLFAVDILGAHRGRAASSGVFDADDHRRVRQIRYRCHDDILAGLDVLLAALDVPQTLVGAPMMCADYVGAVLAPREDKR